MARKKRMTRMQAREFPATSYVRGAVFGLAAVSIWAGNIVVAGLGLRSSLTPWDITAIRFAVAGLLYLPPYAIWSGDDLFSATWDAIALQGLVQGLLTAVVSYVVYGRAVSILGASSGAAFAASCPVMTALMAIPVLGEWPSGIEWAAIALISAGVYAVGGGPLPRARKVITTP